MNRILITGAAGFLGVNLANHLLEDENNIVFGIDNFSSSSISNLYSLLKNERFNLIEQDVEQRIALSVDCVYHLAGCGDLSGFYSNKFDYCYKMLQINKNILDYCSLSGADLLFVTDFFDNENVLYSDFLKLANDLILEYSSKNKLNTKIARLAETYGPYSRIDDSRFIPSAIKCAFNNEDIIIEKDEYCYFTYSKDAAMALDLIMNNYTDKEIIDVAFINPQLKSDTAKLIKNFTKSKSNIIIKDTTPKKDESKPDVEYLNTALNFRAKTPILEGISKTVDYFKLMYFS